MTKLSSTKFSSTNQPKKRGRRAGSQNKINRQLKEKGNKLINQLLEKALDGCLESARIVSQFLPRTKNVAPLVNFDLPEEGTALERLNVVVNAVANGELDAETAKFFVVSLGQIGRQFELEELHVQVSELEHIVDEIADRLSPSH